MKLEFSLRWLDGRCLTFGNGIGCINQPPVDRHQQRGDDVPRGRTEDTHGCIVAQKHVPKGILGVCGRLDVEDGVSENNTYSFSDQLLCAISGDQNELLLPDMDRGGRGCTCPVLPRNAPFQVQ